MISTPSVFISSTTEYSGKSVICLGLAVKLKNQGKRVGYFKPLGKTPVFVDDKTTDADAAMMREYFKLEDPIQDISPVVVTQDLKIKSLQEEIPNLTTKVMNAYKRISTNKDIVIIGGAGTLYDGMHMGISGTKIAKSLKSKVILVDRYDQYFHDICIDCLLSAQQVLRDQLIGVVLNRIEPSYMEHIERLVVPFLQKKGLPVFGVLPYDKSFDVISVGELIEILHGHLIVGQENTSNLVENFVIGAMDVDSAMRHFIKRKNKAVITGGFRSDIILAALETSTKCLILTGNQIPDKKVLDKAQSAQIPVVVVETDTLKTVEEVESHLGRMRITGERKIQAAIDLFNKYVDANRIISALGL